MWEHHTNLHCWLIDARLRRRTPDDPIHSHSDIPLIASLCLCNPISLSLHHPRGHYAKRFDRQVDNIGWISTSREHSSEQLCSSKGNDLSRSCGWWCRSRKYALYSVS